MRSVVITGASTGIGWASAKLLLDRGFRVFGSVRKQADADPLRNEFGANFTPLIFDVTDEAAVLAAGREVRSALNGETLAGLVNNAGIAVSGPVLELAADEFRRQMEVNFIGPIIATQAFGPLLGSDPTLKGPKGRIVMISSVAGRNGNPMTSAYSASKHALEGLSESLRRELMLFGIDVIIIAPGAVKTPIWSKAEEVDISAYKNSPYFPALKKIRAFMLNLGATGLPAEIIAEKVFGALTLPNPKVRYTIVPDPMQRWMAAVLPKRTLDRIIAKRLGLTPQGMKSAVMTRIGKTHAELTLLANAALRAQPGCETASVPALSALPVREGRNWEIPNVVLGDSLISDVDRAVITVHHQLGRKFFLLADN